jgi:DNA polymerase III alpha subunit
MLEVLAFPESFAKLENVLKAGAMLLVRGRVTVEDAGTRLVISDAKPIEDAVEAPVSLLRVRLARETVSDVLLDSLKSLLAARPGICAVELGLIFSDGKELRLGTTQHVRADRNLIEELQDLCGAEAVEIVRETSRAAAGSSYN